MAYGVMMSTEANDQNPTYNEVKRKIQNDPKHWLITGVAGFIGSNLLEHLLKLNQTVCGIDNFITGKRKNLKEVVLFL